MPLRLQDNVAVYVRADLFETADGLQTHEGIQSPSKNLRPALLP